MSGPRYSIFPADCLSDPRCKDVHGASGLQRKRGKINRDELWDKQAGLCWYCGRAVAHSSDWVPTDDGYYLPEQLLSSAIEHQLPKCRGGTNDSSNLVLACTRCNSEKGRKTLDEYRLWRGLAAFHGEAA